MEQGIYWLKEERMEISMKTHRLTAVVSVVSYFERSASRPLALPSPSRCGPQHQELSQKRLRREEGHASLVHALGGIGSH